MRSMSMEDDDDEIEVDLGGGIYDKQDSPGRFDANAALGTNSVEKELEMGNMGHATKALQSSTTVDLSEVKIEQDNADDEGNFV